MKIKAIVCSLLLYGIAMAADINGKWRANVPARGGDTREVVYNFKVDGDKLTGTATGFQGQEIPISDGKVEGDNISFNTKIEFNGNTIVMVYKGTVSGDEIKFTQEREGSERPPREFVAKRATS